jgi:NAD(P)-dependent dehydrogenase (short-subunit alcohol dehydrogenase family)
LKQPSATILTGATGGLGAELALRLGVRGHQLVLLGRNHNKLRAVRREVIARGGPPPTILGVDFGSLKQTAEVGHALNESYGPLSTIVNNAAVGGSTVCAARPIPGVKPRLIVNYLAPVVLTHSILTSAPGRPIRVVNVASTGQAELEIPPAGDALPDGDWHTYKQSKFALIVWGMTLASRCPRASVTSVHPATDMPTRMTADAGVEAKASIAAGADAVVAQLAPRSRRGIGEFFCGKTERAVVLPAAHDEEYRDKLWRWTVDVSGADDIKEGDLRLG